MSAREEAWREKLAAELVRRNVWSRVAERYAEFLLPVVREIAAEELRAAAEELRDHQAKGVVKASDLMGVPFTFDREVGRAAGYGAAAQRVADRADALCAPRSSEGVQGDAGAPDNALTGLSGPGIASSDGPVR